ncbi:trypsin-like serine peptidase [Actinomadura rupiterrae]|uniref:trypsin-like serine peptidase n=1 Tax=Actinomadura rupiterrae TaxID=559627 RepID=UPI0020A462EB|nr:trypsin-like peptidase domain-containing protein [Actinomadura rupiterrae]MCP2342852.1 V8-like Glu-specific endopeptidase [Actinomadura rupiterrae]
MARPSYPLLTLSAVAAGLAIVSWPPSAGGGAAEAARQAARPLSDTAAGSAHAPESSSGAFDGLPAVGALFEVDGSGKLGDHSCTASVVDSPGRDLVVTAAHCVGGGSRRGDIGMAFAPGYHNGQTPYGVWRAVAFYDPPEWAGSSDPDSDVGFLQVTDVNGGAKRVQDVTGAMSLEADGPVSGPARVVGYPSDTERPVSCRNRVEPYSTTQLRFTCGGFPNGTSGGPFLTGDDEKTVVGVIGGYQQGGDSPDVSYSVTFGSKVKDLYQAASASSAAGSSS